jgi:hypothetical protein
LSFPPSLSFLSPSVVAVVSAAATSLTFPPRCHFRRRCCSYVYARPLWRWPPRSCVRPVLALSSVWYLTTSTCKNKLAFKVTYWYLPIDFVERT